MVGGEMTGKCHESLCKGAKFDESKYFRNLDFATMSYGCSTPKLCRKLLETTSNKIHKEHFSGQKFGIEIFLFAKQINSFMHCAC